MNNYIETAKDMIISNYNIEGMLYDDIPITSKENRIINIELFFLTFELFKKYLMKTNMYSYIKDLISSNDYYIKDNILYINDREVSFRLLEITFIKTLAEYKRQKERKIVHIDNQFNNSKIVGINNRSNSKIISLYNEPIYDYNEEAAITELNRGKIVNAKNVDIYLREITSETRDFLYDAILNFYNYLKTKREDNILKTNMTNINENSQKNKLYKDFIIFLINLYPIQYYAKDKIRINYSKISLPNIEVDTNHYRYDDSWNTLNLKYENLNKRIEILKERQKSKYVTNKEKNKIEILIATIELEKSSLLDQLFDLSTIEEFEVEDGNENLVSYYTGELYNKHILYNLELALNNGHIDIIKKYGRETIVFYAIVEDTVDYIIEIELGKLKNIINNRNIIDSIPEEKRVLTYN